MARFNEMQITSSGIPEWGTPSGFTETIFSLSSASANYVAFFTPTEDVTITHVGLSYEGRSGTPPMQRVSLQRTFLGLPDGSILASKTFTPPADATWDGTFQWVELLNPYNADRGEELCLVLEYFSGAVSNSNRSRYFIAIGNSRIERGHFPYYLTNNGSQVRTGNAPVFGYKSSIRSYGMPLKALSDEAINSPGEAGLRFLLDRGFGSSFQLAGATWIGRLAASAGQTVDLVLYDSDNTEVHRVSFDADHSIAADGSDQTNEFRFDDGALENLDFGEEYFLAIAPGGVTTQTRLRTFDLEESSDMSALRGGSGLFLVTRASPTDPWTEHRDRRPLFTDLIIGGWSV